jgi:ribonuclease BN (tRNA processing enzyme)
MNLTVLGSGAAGGNSGSGCTSFLARSGQTQVLIDCGSGAVGELKRWIDVRTLDAVVISHMHLDHILDLVTLRAAFRYAPEPFEERIPLCLPPGGREILDGLAAPLDLDHHSPLFFDQVFEVDEYNPIDSLQIGQIGIDFAPTQHPMPAWAMRIAQAGGEHWIGYTSDTGPITNLGMFFRGVDTLICEATLLESTISPMERSHLTAAEAGRLASTCQAKKLVLTHFWEELGSERLLAAAAETFSGPIELAWPGLEITVG